MTDYQVLVNAIRSELLADRPRSVSQFQIYSRQYADVCRDVNRRLTLCSRFINNGNAPEAVRLANSNPNLLDICYILNFDELSEWRNLCNSIEGLEPFEQLQYENIEKLRQAIQNNSQTEFLLSKYRLLSLRKEKLDERLYLLYQLSKIEPNNVIWKNLIPKYEIACAEMFRESYVHLRIANDNAAINALRNKIQMIPWTSFPNNLYNEINNWNKEANLKYAKERIKNLADSLHDAYGAGDLERACQIDQEIFAIIKKQNIRSSELPSALYNELVFVHNWIEACQRDDELHAEYEQYIDEIEGLLDDKAEKSEIEYTFRKLTEVAEQAHENIPQQLQDRVEETVNQYNCQKTRKWKLIYILTFSVIFLVALFLYFYIENAKLKTVVKMESALVAEHLESYKAAVSSKTGKEDYQNGSKEKISKDIDGLSKALARLDKLSKENTRAFSSMPIRQLDQEALGLKDAENRRVANFKTALHEAEKSVANYEDKKSKSKGEVVSPSSHLNQIALAEANKLRRTSGEEQQYEELERKFEKLLGGEQSDQEEKFRASYNLLLEKNKSLEKVDPPTDDYVLQLKKLKEEAAALVTDQIAELYKRQKSELIAIIEKRISEASNQLEELTFQSKLLSDLSRIIDSLNDISVFKTSLSEVAGNYSNFAAADDFKKVASEIDMQDLFTEWNSFLTKNKKYSDLFALDKESVDKIKDEISKMKYSKIAFDKKDQLLNTLDEFNEFFEKNDEKKISQKIIDFLNNFKTEDLYVKVYDKNESGYKYYYLTEKFSRNNQKYTLVYRVNQEGTIEKSEVTSTKKLENNVSPQVVFINATEPLLKNQRRKKNGNSDSWDSDIQKVLNSLIASTDIDPVVQLILFKGITECLKFHPAYKSLCEEWISVCDKSKFEFDINWRNPNNSDLPDQRKLAQAAMDSLFNLVKKTDLVKEKRDQYKDFFNYQFVPIGILYKQGNFWACMTKRNNSALKDTLYVVRADKNATEGTVITFSGNEDGFKVMPEESQKKLLLEGLPVYRIETKSKQNVNRENEM